MSGANEKKDRKGVKTMAIQNIFVVGAGLMGSGIAQNAITSGYTVTLNDQRQEALDRAQANIGTGAGRSPP